MIAPPISDATAEMDIAMEIFTNIDSSVEPPPAITLSAEPVWNEATQRSMKDDTDIGLTLNHPPPPTTLSTQLVTNEEIDTTIEMGTNTGLVDDHTPAITTIPSEASIQDCRPIIENTTPLEPDPDGDTSPVVTTALADNDNIGMTNDDQPSTATIVVATPDQPDGTVAAADDEPSHGTFEATQVTAMQVAAHTEPPEIERAVDLPEPLMESDLPVMDSLVSRFNCVCAFFYLTVNRK